MIEHEIISVEFDVNRGVTHEMVRHRPPSFAQESTRYCNYSNDKFGNDIAVIDPSGAFWNKPEEHALNEAKLKIWVRATEQAKTNYFELLELGAKPQEARDVLLTATKATIVITANLREWRHILKLRAVGTTGAPHPQMLEVMVPLLKELKALVPVIFEDLTPMKI